MTNHSETSELIARLRGGMPKDRWGGFDVVSALDMMREAADTIDRLTSTGAVAWQKPVCPYCKGSGVEADYVGPEMRPIATTCSHCNGEGFDPDASPPVSPREGHVEVPVEPTAQVPSIDDITVAAELQFPGKGYAHDRMAFRLGADWCAKQLSALPHNQGETKP